MKRIALLAGLCLLSALGADAQEQLILGNFDPNATETTVRAALESIATVDEVYRINPLNDGRGISVFRVTYGKEGARIETLRRITETGMVGYPLDSPDECTLSVYNRKDQTAVKALDTNPYLRTLQEAEKELDDAEAALAEIEVVILDIKENFEEGKGLLEMRIRMLTAAREATTRARAVYQGAYDKMRAAPSRENFLALLRATVDVQSATRAENAAAAAVQEAEVEVEKFRQEFGQVQATKKERATKVYEKQQDKDIASRALDSAWNMVGTSIREEIIAAAESLAQDALDLADAIAHEAEHVRQSVLFYNSHSFYGAGDLLKETAQVLNTCSALADEEANAALNLVEEAKKLPSLGAAGIASQTTQEALAKFFVQFAKTHRAVVSTSMGYTMRSHGGSTRWPNKLYKALDIAEEQCGSNECNDSLADLRSEADQLDRAALQQAMSQQSQMFNSLTNLQKSKHDAAMAAIQNVR